MNERLKTFDELLIEATQSVEKELLAEDEGWVRLGAVSSDILTADTRKTAVNNSRTYFAKDPLAKQAIRLWTDYTFGPGMSTGSEEESTQKVIDSFWKAKANQAVLSARGQRKSSDKLLVDGEVFFAIFLGAKGKATIRRIDPLEITEIITDPDDIDNVLLYKREWMDTQGKPHTLYYPSTLNPKIKNAKDSSGKDVKPNSPALVYHLPFNTIGQRGIPLLYPAIEWIKQYRKFLASRVAIMLALARFSWRTKVEGGQAAINAAKTKIDGATPEAGAWLLENAGAETGQLKVDTGANQAYQDGRMLKLQVCSAVGISEQYFGDISIGNLATAKTVELPMVKMFQSYQQVWNDAYQDIDEVVFESAALPEDKWYVDRDFPPIAPEDAVAIAQAMVQIVSAFPDFSESEDVRQQALIALGVNNPSEVLAAIKKESISDPNIKLAKAIQEFRRVYHV